MESKNNNNQEEEKKGTSPSDQPENQINSVTEDLVKQLEERLGNIKLDGDEREKLRNIVEAGGNADETNTKIKEFIDGLKDKKTTYMDSKQLRKIAPLYDTHDFWDSQPVPHTTDNVTEADYDKAINAVNKVEDIREEPLDIPAGFTWCNVDIANDDEANEVYDLLTQNYVEDDDNMFRFDYSIKFLQWALTPPGYKKEWLVGVRGGKKNKLFGFISGTPVHLTVNGKKMFVPEINFLCVHKNLRTKRLAPVLIKEITRRVNRQDGWQAIFTAGVVIPTPIAETTYWHRSLNPKKLIEVGFSSLPKNTPLSRYVKIYKVPEKTATPGLRAMEKKDVKVVTKLLNEYLQKFKLHIQFSEAEVTHFLLPQEWVLESYVVEDDKGKITDFISFYSLPSSVLKHETHKILNVAYSFYNVPNKFSMEQLMRDALVLAKNKGYDVFNALDIQQNEEIFTELKFGVGDGNLHYYLFNWRVHKMKPQDMGMVLV